MRTFLNYLGLCALLALVILIVFVYPAWVEEGLVWPG